MIESDRCSHIGIYAIVEIPPLKQMGGSIPTLAHRPIVLEVHERSTVAHHVVGVIEHRAKRSRGNSLVTFGIAACQGEPGDIQFPEIISVAVTVEIMGDPVVDGVEFRIIKILPEAAVAGCGKQQSCTILVLMTVTQSLLVGAKAGKFTRCFRSVEILSKFGNDVDNTEDGIVAVNRGTRRSEEHTSELQ